MTEEVRRRRREERRRNRKPMVSYISSDYAVPTPDGEDAFWYPSYYYQITRTLGLEQQCSHPELQTLITYSVENGGYSLLGNLAQRVRKGARFAAGERVEVPCAYYEWETCTVEFRESKDEYGPCLRAVVLGLEEEYQALPSEEADRWLIAHGPLYDPYEGL